MKNTIDKKTQNTLKLIHGDIYKSINEHYVDVFLCGGASSLNHTSTRDRVRDYLAKIQGVRILYPEDLFIEMLNKNKEYDLLSLEGFLAENCDLICIVCESAGSLVELGAFTNNEKTVNKVVAVIDEKRKKDQSFIMLGPIKIIKKKNKSHVVFYNRDKIDLLSRELIKLIRLNKNKELHSNPKKSSNKPLNTIIGLYYFIPLVLYFYKYLHIEKITDFIKFLFIELGYKQDEFDTLFKSALKLLYKEKYISKHIRNGESMYSLTDKGYKKFNDILNNLAIENKKNLYNGIRFGIMMDEYYK